jgi:hypothetical protein
LLLLLLHVGVLLVEVWLLLIVVIPVPSSLSFPSYPNHSYHYLSPVPMSTMLI